MTEEEFVNVTFKVMFIQILSNFQLYRTLLDVLLVLTSNYSTFPAYPISIHRLRENGIFW